ncbi:MAG: hypothetical protein VBE63_21835 [Lamprobacter sp.]|uniref:hypothetical protein n=1 Tax=Lamprobacter sp. TaxID=3100796 RepID=UPI002B264021|nr:hypothetical protein [Lamprobacter sp.]MEA3642559.1 hypothetical protein [Lamprobacter sp.]
MTQDPVDQMALEDPVETLEVIDLQLIRKALTEAQSEPTEAARARAFIAALSALLLMSGDRELGNAIGADWSATARCRCTGALDRRLSLWGSARDHRAGFNCSCSHCSTTACASALGAWLDTPFS